MSKGRILAAILALPLALYVGTKLWVRHNAKGVMEQMTAFARPFAGIQYRSLSSTLLTGRVVVEDLQIRPHGLNDAIHIRELSVRTGNPVALVTSFSGLKKGEYPSTLELRVQGLTVNVDGPIYGAVSASSRSGETSQGNPHCGGLAAMSSKALRAMGYDTLNMDLVARYEYQSVPDQLIIHADGTARELASVQTKITVSGPTYTWKSDPRLTQAKVVYKDLSYSDRLKKLCTSAGHVTDAAFIEAEISKPDSLWHRWLGIVPGPGLQRAQQQFLEKPGEVIVEAKSNGTSLRSLKFYTPQDLVAQTNLQVSVNGLMVSDLGYAREVAPAPSTAAGQATGLEGLWRAGTDHENGPASTGAEDSGYRVVRVNELPRHVGKQVRISMPKGVVREGKLLGANPSLVTVARGYGRGEMNFEMLTKQVEKAEVRD